MKQYVMAKPELGRAEERAVIKVLRSGVLSLGPHIKEFESKFAKRIGVRYACAVSSGTAGLHVALLAAGIGRGDEVITSPFSFIASSNAILYVGAKPVFVDIDWRTYNIDCSKIEARITPRTRAILVVHIFGQPADMTAITKIAKKHKLSIIEDACEAISATHRGKQVGTFGQSAVFAFYPNKQITTGEGGMITTNSKDVVDICRSLINQGRSTDVQWLDHSRLGYNYRMGEMSAALGIHQLDRLSGLIRKRARLAQWYTEFFSNYKEIIGTPLIGSRNTHTWFVYVVRIHNKNISRDDVILSLKKCGVHSKPYLPSIHLFSFYKSVLKHRAGDFPVSEQISNSALALPFSLDLTKKDVHYIGSQLVRILNACK